MNYWICIAWAPIFFYLKLKLSQRCIGYPLSNYLFTYAFYQLILVLRLRRNATEGRLTVPSWDSLR